MHDEVQGRRAELRREIRATQHRDGVPRLWGTAEGRKMRGVSLRRRETRGRSV